MWRERAPGSVHARGAFPGVVRKGGGWQDGDVLRAHRHEISKRATRGPLTELNRAESQFRLGLVVGVGALAIVRALSPEPSADVQLAYLDPGSGSFLIQALVALVAGIAVALRTYWEKVRSFLGFSGSGSSKAGADPTERDD